VVCFTPAQVVGVHPKGYLLCQTNNILGLKPFKDEPPVGQCPLNVPPVSLAVPLSLCPASLPLGDLPVFSCIELDGEITVQERWEPWDLPQQPAAETAAIDSAEPSTAAAAAAATSDAQQQQHQQLAEGGELSEAALQSWRQGVLGMWKQPFWTVQLQLLPLEQQQDPASLQASLARLKQQHKATWGDDSWDGTDSKAAGSVGEGAEAGAGEVQPAGVAGGDSGREGLQSEEEEGVVAALKRSNVNFGDAAKLNFGDAANLLLFARLVPCDGSEDESSSSDDDND
jgi:hypothetical protein